MSNILRLRTLANAAFTTLNREFTWEELDQNFISLLNLLNNAGSENFPDIEPYDPLKEYKFGIPPRFVSYENNIYSNISADDHTGIIPGTNSNVWKLESVGVLSHEQNTDFRLAAREQSILNPSAGTINIGAFNGFNRFALVDFFGNTGNRSLSLQTNDPSNRIDYEFLIYVFSTSDPDLVYVFETDANQDVGTSPLLLQTGDFAVFRGAFGPDEKTTLMYSNKKGGAELTHEQNTDYRLASREESILNPVAGTINIGTYSGFNRFALVDLIGNTGERALSLQTTDPDNRIDYEFLIYVFSTSDPDLVYVFETDANQDVGTSPLILQTGDFAVFRGAFGPDEKTTLMYSNKKAGGAGDVQYPIWNFGRTITDSTTLELADRYKYLKFDAATDKTGQISTDFAVNDWIIVEQTGDGRLGFELADSPATQDQIDGITRTSKNKPVMIIRRADETLNKQRFTIFSMGGLGDEERINENSYDLFPDYYGNTGTVGEIEPPSPGNNDGTLIEGLSISYGSDELVGKYIVFYNWPELTGLISPMPATAHKILFSSTNTVEIDPPTSYASTSVSYAIVNPFVVDSLNDNIIAMNCVGHIVVEVPAINPDFERNRLKIYREGGNDPDQEFSGFVFTADPFRGTTQTKLIADGEVLELAAHNIGGEHWDKFNSNSLGVSCDISIATVNTTGLTNTTNETIKHTAWSLGLPERLEAVVLNDTSVELIYNDEIARRLQITADVAAIRTAGNPNVVITAQVNTGSGWVDIKSRTIPLTATITRGTHTFTFTRKLSKGHKVRVVSRTDTGTYYIEALDIVTANSNA